MREIKLDQPATSRFSDFGGYTFDAGEPPTVQDALRSLMVKWRNTIQGMDDPDTWPPRPTLAEAEADLPRLQALYDAGQWSRVGRR